MFGALDKSTSSPGAGHDFFSKIKVSTSDQRHRLSKGRLH